jgi:hypothetical protein
MAAEQVAATVVQGVGGHSQGVLGFMCCVCWVGGSKMYTQSSRYLCSPSLKKKALTGVQSVQKRRTPTPSAPHEFADSAPGRGRGKGRSSGSGRGSGRQDRTGQDRTGQAKEAWSLALRACCVLRAGGGVARWSEFSPTIKPKPKPKP